MEERLKKKLYDIIFKADTPAGKAFDIGLLIAILLSVGIVLIESVEQYFQNYARFFIYTEWAFTFLFTAEYIIRIIISPRRRKYIFSFFRNNRSSFNIAGLYIIGIYRGSFINHPP